MGIDMGIDMDIEGLGYGQKHMHRHTLALHTRTEGTHV